jgi:hypothetical protein
MLYWANSLLDSVTPLAAFPTTESLATRYIPLALLAVFLVASLIKAVRVWGEIHDVEEPDAPDDLLAAFQQAHAQGELDDDEFARVSEKLAGSSPTAGLADAFPPPRDASAPDRVAPPDGHGNQPPSRPPDSRASTES